MAASTLIFYVNGKKVIEKNADPEMPLLTYLRAKCSKLGCGEGGCGACTVMISKYDTSAKLTRHTAINACLVPVCSLFGVAVTTIEGIGSIRNGLHPVQERIIEYHGSQCGFCTPGIVMKMYTLLRNHPHPTETQIDSAFQGNLCRCTGYRPILEAFRTFTKGTCQSNFCCKKDITKIDETMGVEFINGFLPTDSTQDPIFPPELRHEYFERQSLMFVGERVTWYRPTTLNELLDLKVNYPNAVIVAGNTEIGIDIGLKKMYYPVLVAVTHIPEFKTIHEEENHMIIGAAVTLSEMDQLFRTIIKELPDYKTRGLSAIVNMIQWFAGDQIRNVASIGGNIMTSSPISDLNPLLVACRAKLYLISKDGGIRTVQMDNNWFTGYRKTSIKPEEVLMLVRIPHTKRNEYVYGYKQSQRREDDIAIVNAGMHVTFEGQSNVVKDIYLAFGGMSLTLVIASEIMKRINGRKWDESLLKDVIRWLPEELPLSADSPGGMVEYRQALALSFFFKFFLAVQTDNKRRLCDLINICADEVDTQTLSDCSPRKNVQIFEEISKNQSLYDTVGRSIPHVSGLKQATGEAIYIDDMPNFEGELCLAFVTSSKAHARLLNVDLTNAKSSPGFVDYIGYDSVEGSNKWGVTVPNNEEYFASEEVTCVGQIIGAVLADSKVAAQRAAKLVTIQYEDLESIITISDAIRANSFYHDFRTIKYGDIEVGFSECDHIIEGQVSIGGQDHFYLETQSAIALSKNEDGEIEMFVSTQNPTGIQSAIAKALGIAANKVVVRVKRIGGGFGGKETRSAVVAIPVAVSAMKQVIGIPMGTNCAQLIADLFLLCHERNFMDKLVKGKELELIQRFNRTSRHGRPVRCILERQEDMTMIGNRHAFLGIYKVGFMHDGKINALDLKLYNNAGNTVDLSPAVMQKALLSCTNCYRIPNMYVEGKLCKTNTPSNTAFRGFGAPQAMFIAETWIDHVASYLQKDSVEIRRLNMVEEGSALHFKQLIENCPIQKCWDECLSRSNYVKRKNSVEKYNSTNRWKKRGIAIIPTLFGIGISEAAFLNQAGALVHIYNDGSVLISHGGIEMGQGLHTKMLQIAGRVLGIPVNKIHISETSTASVPNTSATVASISSDLNGMAIQKACVELNKRLEPYVARNKYGTWEEWVQAAYLDRVSLSSTGFYKTADIYFDKVSQTGRPYNYVCTGTACSEVEIDCLTGDHQIIRTDIVMDVGQSLNPTIDIGQIEGAFVQGYGMFMLEQVKASPEGYIYTRGPGSYKIPGFSNIPGEFNVALLKGSKNIRAVYSSKAVGEPPLFLSASVFFAVKNAIQYARKEEGDSKPFRLDSPATPERIRMACKDNLIKKKKLTITSHHSKYSKAVYGYVRHKITCDIVI